MGELADHLKKASKRQKELHKDKLSGWASKGRKFLKKMTPEEKHEYFSRIRAGKKVK